MNETHNADNRAVEDATCPVCGATLEVEMRATATVPALGFLQTSVVIDGYLFTDDVWEVERVGCPDCEYEINVSDYEVGGPL